MHCTMLFQISLQCCVNRFTSNSRIVVYLQYENDMFLCLVFDIRNSMCAR